MGMGLEASRLPSRWVVVLGVMTRRRWPGTELAKRKVFFTRACGC
jgi:hypothetical protein